MHCLFCKIIQKEIPATLCLEEEDLIVIQDIKPQAPTHLLILPKKHIATINQVTHEDTTLLGNMVIAAKTIAHTKQLDEFGYRLVFNINAGGGQDVYHIHLHLLGGRQMTWPPG